MTGAMVEEDAVCVVTAFLFEIGEEEEGDHVPREDAREALQKDKPHGLLFENFLRLCPREFEGLHFGHVLEFRFGLSARHFLHAKIDEHRDDQSRAYR